MMIVTVMYGLAMLGYVGTLYDSDHYNIDVKNGTLSNFQQNLTSSLTGISDIGTEVQGGVQTNTGIVPLDIGTTVITGAYNVLLLPFNLLTFIIGWINLIGSELGLPQFVITGILTLVGVTIAFSILSAVFRKDV